MNANIILLTHTSSHTAILLPKQVLVLHVDNQAGREVDHKNLHRTECNQFIFIMYITQISQSQKLQDVREKLTLDQRLKQVASNLPKCLPAMSTPVLVRLLLGARTQTASGVRGTGACRTSVRISEADAPGVDRKPKLRQDSGMLV